MLCAGLDERYPTRCGGRLACSFAFRKQCCPKIFSRCCAPHPLSLETRFSLYHIKVLHLLANRLQDTARRRGGTRRKAESLALHPLISPLRASLLLVPRCCCRRGGLASRPSLLAYARYGWCPSFPYMLYYLSPARALLCAAFVAVADRQSNFYRRPTRLLSGERPSSSFSEQAWPSWSSRKSWRCPQRWSVPAQHTGDQISPG